MYFCAVFTVSQSTLTEIKIVKNNKKNTSETKYEDVLIVAFVSLVFPKSTGT